MYLQRCWVFTWLVPRGTVAALASSVYTIQSCAMSRDYWAVQAQLLTPLTFVPWLRLLPVRTFCTMEGGDSAFANFTLPTLEARSQNVSDKKQ